MQSTLLDLPSIIFKEYGDLGNMIAIIILYFASNRRMHSLNYRVQSLSRDINLIERAVFYLANQFIRVISELSSRPGVEKYTDAWLSR